MEVDLDLAIGAKKRLVHADLFDLVARANVHTQDVLRVGTGSADRGVGAEDADLLLVQHEPHLVDRQLLRGGARPLTCAEDLLGLGLLDLRLDLADDLLRSLGNLDGLRGLELFSLDLRLQLLDGRSRGLGELRHDEPLRCGGITCPHDEGLGKCAPIATGSGYWATMSATCTVLACPGGRITLTRMNFAGISMGTSTGTLSGVGTAVPAGK